MPSVEVMQDGRLFVIACGPQTPDRMRRFAAELEAAAAVAEGVEPPLPAVGIAGVADGILVP